MGDEALLVRAAALYIPLAAVVALGWWRRPGRRLVAGATLATIWNLAALYPLHLASRHWDWWSYEADGGLFSGMPVDLYLGWALLWGAVPVLAFPRGRLVVPVALALWADLVFMPAAAPVVRLGPMWLAGEALGLSIGLLPGLVLARWTIEQRHLAARTTLQAVAFATLVLVGATAALEATGGTWATLGDHPTWVTSTAVQVLLVPAAVALAAVAELVRRGGGTPFPWDPPRRLVTTGPYAYVANPMQLATAVILAGGTLLLRNWGVAAVAAASVAFAAGLAAWHEDLLAGDRFGGGWRRYRASVRTWRPRWQPYVEADAVLYVAAGCEPCSTVGAWLQRRRPVGLRLRGAEDRAGPGLRRITYVAADGTTASGIAAVAHALEHLHLGWAITGWALRLPGVGLLAQTIADAVGAGPRDLPAAPATDADRRCAATGPPVPNLRQ